MNFLAGLTRDAIEAARVRPGERIAADLPANILGETLIRPGGRGCYPAIWTQDFALTLGTGFVSADEAYHHLCLLAAAQNGPLPRVLEGGAIIPPHAVPDHLLFDGQAVFFPGTYSPQQGGEPWGTRPPVNNHYDLILIAHHLLETTGQGDFLTHEVAGCPLIERLRRAFSAPTCDSRTGLVTTQASARAVGFIFCDSVYLTGALLFASLLRWRAGQQLARLEEALGQTKAAQRWREAVAPIPENLAAFDDPERVGGWLLAATEVGRQPDVWGTAYSLYLGLLSPARAEAARKALIGALDAGTIQREGAVRHLPLDHDFSETSAWEKAVTARHTYQNGGYWHTPTGWVIAALAETAPEHAQQLFEALITHMQANDFRKGEAWGAPWEWLGARGGQTALFLGSVTVPYSVLRGLR